MKNETYKLIDNGRTIIDNQMIINKLEKILVFEEFETKLLSKFDGSIRIEQILKKLHEEFSDPLVETEFLNFVREMIDKEVLIKID